jgi:hypothetical protein
LRVRRSDCEEQREQARNDGHRHARGAP